MMKLIDETIEEDHVLYSDEEANYDDDAQSDDTEGYSSEEANEDDGQPEDDIIGTMVMEPLNSLATVKPLNSFDTTKKPTRGLTRLSKLRSQYTNSGGVRLAVEFDNLGRFTGQNRSKFSSFLGDAVREIVGLRHLSWREVTKELRDKLWEHITVILYFNLCILYFEM